MDSPVNFYRKTRNIAMVSFYTPLYVYTSIWVIQLFLLINLLALKCHRGHVNIFNKAISTSLRYENSTFQLVYSTASKNDTCE